MPLIGERELLRWLRLRAVCRTLRLEPHTGGRARGETSAAESAAAISRKALARNSETLGQQAEEIRANDDWLLWTSKAARWRNRAGRRLTWSATRPPAQLLRAICRSRSKATSSPRDAKTAEAARELLRRYRDRRRWRPAECCLAERRQAALTDIDVTPSGGASRRRDYDCRRYGPFLGVSDDGDAADDICRAAWASPKATALTWASPITIGVAVDAERLGGVGEVVVGPAEYADAPAEVRRPGAHDHEHRQPVTSALPDRSADHDRRRRDGRRTENSQGAACRCLQAVPGDTGQQAAGRAWCSSSSSTARGALGPNARPREGSGRVRTVKRNRSPQDPSIRASHHIGWVSRSGCRDPGSQPCPRRRHPGGVDRWCGAQRKPIEPSRSPA